MVIVITAAVMIGIGSIAALIWWSLADRTFPGAAARTGQGLRTKRTDAKPQGTVIAGFDDKTERGAGA